MHATLTQRFRTTVSINTTAVRRALALGASAGLCANAAHAQVVVHSIALSGDPFPVALPVTIADFGFPAVSEQGHVAVGVGLAGPFVTPDDDVGIMYYDTVPGLFFPITRKGQSPPGTTMGEVFAGPGPGLGIAPFSRITVGIGGEVTFRSTLTGLTVTSANDTGLWWFPPGGTPEMLIREDGPIAGTPFKAKFFFTKQVCAGPPEAPAWALLDGPGITSANNEALILGTPFGPDLIAQEGMLIAGPGSPEFAGIGAGDTTAHSPGPFVSMRATVRGAGVTAANDETVHVDFAALGALPQIIVREGDPAPLPQLPGAIHNGMFTPPDTAEPEFATFLGTVAGPGITAANDEVVWWYIHGPNILEQLAHEGDPVPNAPQLSHAGLFGHPVISANSLVTFAGAVAGPGVVAGVNDRALFFGGGTLADMVLRRGDSGFNTLAPGQTIDGPFDAPCMNANGDIAVFTKIAGPNVQLGVNDDALMLIQLGNPASTTIIARTGEMFQVAPGDVRLITGIAFSNGNDLGSGGFDGRPTMLQGDGSVVMRLDFANSTSGIFRASPCYANCDHQGGLNILDYICFGNAYANGNSYADCNRDGALNILDYICFGSAYAAGCP